MNSRNHFQPSSNRFSTQELVTVLKPMAVQILFYWLKKLSTKKSAEIITFEAQIHFKFKGQKPPVIYIRYFATLWKQVFIDVHVDVDLVFVISGAVKKFVSASAEMQASDNPLLSTPANDPMLFCTGFKKNRFYIFTRQEANTR